MYGYLCEDCESWHMTEAECEESRLASKREWADRLKRFFEGLPAWLNRRTT